MLVGNKDLARRDNLTIRQLYLAIAGARGHQTILGTPVTIADQLEDWFVNGGADGFNIMPPYLPGGLDEFVELVIPELQRRGLFRTEYEGRTLSQVSVATSNGNQEMNLCITKLHLLAFNSVNATSAPSF